MVLSNVIVDVTITRRAFVFGQSRAIKNSTVELLLPTDDIMDLLNLCLTSTHFQYNGKHCKQLQGTAMGSPVSVCRAKHRGTSPKLYLFGYEMSCIGEF